MKLLFGFVFSGLLAGAGFAETNPAPAPTKPARPIPAIERVVIIGLDGMRPDRLLLAEAPVLRGLMARGAYTMWMQTTAMATTLPSFTSMLTGVSPRKHGIYWNKLLPLTTPEWPRRPTLFEMAKQAGYSTVLVAGKAKLAHLNKPGTIDGFFAAPDDEYPDIEVANEAIARIKALRPDVLFVHFPEVDTIGHTNGWGSPQLLVAINHADTQVGRVLAALDEEGLLAGALVMIASDHGGAGKTHGPDDFRSRTVPWIAAGPGVKRGYDLTQSMDLVVTIEDVAATACYVLGLPQQSYFDGKPLSLAFEQAEGK